MSAQTVSPVHTTGRAAAPLRIGAVRSLRHSLALAGDVRLERRAQRELHVGRGEVKLAVLAPELNAAEHQDGGARRDCSGDECEPVDERLSRDADFESCPHHYF